MIIFLNQKLWKLSTFTRTSLAAHKSDKVIVNGFDKLLLFKSNWKGFSKLLDCGFPGDNEISLWDFNVEMRDILNGVGLVLVI